MRNRFTYGLAIALLLASSGARAALIEMFDAASGALLNSIAEAEAVIAASGGADFVTTASSVDFSGDSFPGAAFGAPPDDRFVMRLTGTLNTDLYDQLSMSHDDGFVVRLGGTDFFSFDGNTTLNTTTSGVLGSIGTVSFEMIYWDQGGAQVAMLSGITAGVSGLAIVDDPAGAAEVPAPTPLALLTVSLIASGAARRLWKL